MLYFISGASRSGKTIIAERLAAKLGISYLSLDWIMMGFTNGIPAFGVHNKLFPDDIAERLWSFFKAMFESMIAVDTDCIIEGEALLPELMTQMLEKYPEKIRICFLGYINVDINQKMKEIRDFSSKKNDWLEDKSDTYVIDHIKNMVAHSKKIEQSCKENNILYFDTSKNFSLTINHVIDYLSA